MGKLPNNDFYKSINARIKSKKPLFHKNINNAENKCH